MSKVESSKTIHEKSLYLNDLGEEFTLIKVNNTFKLKSEYFGDISSSRNKKIPPVELGFIKRVKNHVMKNEVYENFIEKLYYPNQIDYVSIKRRKCDTIIEDVIEIDIDEAYWRTAFLLNVIPEKLYIEGSKESKKISKIGRLICLGSLAKKEDRYTFKGSRLIKRETVRSVLTENIWYSICKRVSDLMLEAKKIAGNDFVLYWVDGIYIKNSPEIKEKIVAMFKVFDYDIKIKENLSIKYTDDQILITDKIKNTTRPFFIPKINKRKSYFTDENLKSIAIEFSKYGVMDDKTEEI